MIIRTVSVLASLLALLVTAIPVAAQDFLPVQQVAKLLSDGRPWAVAKDGHNARITFNPDGTGTLEGPVTMPISWSVKGQEICMDLRFAGSPCLRFLWVAGGLVAYKGNAEDLRLTR